jgi:hypothetical protein
MSAMNSSRILITAGTVAATLVGIVPVANDNSARPGAISVDRTGIAVVADALQGSAATAVIVPAGVTQLDGVATGSPTVAKHVTVRLVRVADGATLFVGTLATFRSLQVAPGDRLRLSFTPGAGYRGLHAAARLSWS